MPSNKLSRFDLTEFAVDLYNSNQADLQSVISN